jgi:Rrf2 family protein
LLAAGYIAKHQKKGIILSTEISKKYNIPLEYLLKIMQQLVKAGLLRSKRGPRGGFSLGKPANKITMLQVIEAVDGPFVSQLHLDEHAKGERFANRVEQTYTKALAQGKAVFNRTKLTDLLRS